MPKTIEFISCLTENSIIFLFMHSLLEKRFRHIITVILVTVTNALILFHCSGLGVFFKTSVFAAITMIGSFILYKAKPHIKATFSIMIIFLFNIINIVLKSSFSLILDVNIVNVFSVSPTRRIIILCLIIETVNALAVYEIYRSFSKTRLDIGRKAWILFCLVMTTFLLVTLTFAEMYHQNYGDDSFFALNFTVSTAFFITGLIIIYFFTHLCNSFNNERNLYVLQSSYDGIKEQLAVQSNNSEKLRKIRHDIRNHLLNAKRLLSRGQYEEAESLVNEMIGQTDSIKLLSEVATGNNIVDAALAVKSAICKSRNIRFDLKYDSLSQIKISEIDVSSLFSNILDNAISAAEKADDPYISLGVFIRGDYLNIVCENAFKGEIEKRDEGKITVLSTTKSNATEHGFGTRIIGEIAQKYDGICVYEYVCGVFKMNVMLKINDN